MRWRICRTETGGDKGMRETGLERVGPDHIGHVRPHEGLGAASTGQGGARSRCPGGHCGCGSSKGREGVRVAPAGHSGASAMVWTRDDEAASRDNDRHRGETRGEELSLLGPFLGWTSPGTLCPGQLHPFSSPPSAGRGWGPAI